MLLLPSRARRRFAALTYSGALSALTQLFTFDPCRDGYATSPGASSANCFACPAYSTDSAERPDRCLLCPGGTTGPAAIRAIRHDQRYLCIPCPPGTHRPALALTALCVACLPGRSSDSGAESCTACEMGRASSTNHRSKPSEKR